MLSRTFVTRTIAVMSLALAAACGGDDNEGENNNNACPPGQVREGNRCVTPGGGGNNNNNNATVEGCTDDDAANFDSSADTDDGSCVYAVTVNVDLTGTATPSPSMVTLVIVDGSSTPPTVSMTEGMTGMWSGVIDLPPGTYRYRIDTGDSASPPKEFTVVDAPLTVNAGAFEDIVGALPFVVSSAFGAAGFFPDADDHELLGDCADRPTDARGECYHFVYTESGDTECGPENSPNCAFAGVQWLNGNGFTDATPVAIEAGANQVSFYAWGATGGEQVQFGYDVTPDGSNTGRSVTETLTTTPTRYTVTLTDTYGAVLFPFFWSATANVSFWVTDIVWEFDEDATAITELPFAVDDAFTGRGGFGPGRVGGNPLHTEDELCPVRAAPSGRDPAGVCHRFVWDSADVQTGDFTGAVWLEGTGFDDAVAVDIPTGSPAVEFYAWLESGTANVEFGVGDLGLGDASQFRRTDYALTTTPQLFRAPLASLGDPASLFGGFVIALTQGNFPSGGTVYVDDIRFVAPGPDFGCTDTNAKNFSSTAIVDDGGCLYDITFNVDMSCPDAVDGSDVPIGEVTGFTDVRLTGPFSNFGTDIILSDPDLDDVWSVTLENLNLATPSFEYLYITDVFASKERLADEAACGLTLSGTGNRIITPVSGSTVNDVYGQCAETCPAASADVSFAVNMNQDVDFNGTDPVSVVGDINLVLEDLDGDGVYTGTTTLDNGAYNYNYQIGSSPVEDEAVPDYCGGPGRQVTVAGENIALPRVSFSDCERVSVPLIVDSIFNDYELGGSANQPAATQVVGDIGGAGCPARAVVDGREPYGECHTFTNTWAAGRTPPYVNIAYFKINGAGSRFLDDGADVLSFVAWGFDGEAGPNEDYNVLFGAGFGAANEDGAEMRQEVTVSATPTRFELPLGPLANYNDVFRPFFYLIAEDRANPPDTGYTLYVDDIHWARKPSGAVSFDDTDIRVVDGGSPELVDSGSVLGTIGEFAANDVRNFVYAFRIPEPVTNDETIVSADFSFWFNNFDGTPTANVDAYAIDVVAGDADGPAAIDPSWWFAGDNDTNFTRIQDDILTPSSTAASRVGLDPAGETALGAFIDAEGAVPGNWVIIRLSPDVAGQTGAQGAYRIQAGEQQDSFVNARMSYRTECTECIPVAPLRTGCTSMTASNFDPRAWVDDGSCVEIVPEALPYVVSTNHSPGGVFAGGFTLGDGTCPGTTRPSGAQGDCYDINVTSDGVEVGALWVNGTGFGDNAPLPIEAGATGIRFYAWTDTATAGTQVSFEAKTDGGGGFRVALEGAEIVTLTDTPVQYTIPLGSADYTTNPVQFPFGFKAAGVAAGTVIYVDDVTWVND